MAVICNTMLPNSAVFVVKITGMLCTFLPFISILCYIWSKWFALTICVIVSPKTKNIECLPPVWCGEVLFNQCLENTPMEQVKSMFY